MIIYKRPIENNELLKWKTDLTNISKQVYDMIIALAVTKNVITKKKIKPIMKVTIFQNLVSGVYKDMTNFGAVILTKFPKKSLDIT